MGKGTNAIGQWLSQKKHFSNFVNGALFQGTQVFTAETRKGKWTTRAHS